MPEHTQTTNCVVSSREGKGRGRAVAGRFDWMRREVLAIVGGIAYYRTPVLIQIGGVNAVWFNRNEHEELMLNFDMPSLTGLQRASIRDNGWVVPPDGVEELVCPPHGRKLRVKYRNGDQFDAEYSTVSSMSELRSKNPGNDGLSRKNFSFPLTVVRVAQIASGSTLQLLPDGTLVGTNSIRGGFVSNGAVGISIGTVSPLQNRGVEEDDPINKLLREARRLQGG